MLGVAANFDQILAEQDDIAYDKSSNSAIDFLVVFVSRQNGQYMPSPSSTATQTSPEARDKPDDHKNAPRKEHN